jgi:hypothetical protein
MTGRKKRMVRQADGRYLFESRSEEAGCSMDQVGGYDCVCACSYKRCRLASGVEDVAACAGL